MFKMKKIEYNLLFGILYKIEVYYLNLEIQIEIFWIRFDLFKFLYLYKNILVRNLLLEFFYIEVFT